MQRDETEKPNDAALIAEFTESYLEKLFYFCLKRTGSTGEAEDLASDSAGNIIPDILVMYYDDLNKIGHMWSSHPLFEKVLGNIEATFAETLKILRQNANPLLHDQLAYCTSMHMLVDLRMITMHDEVNSCRLVPPKNPKHSKVATWLVLER